MIDIETVAERETEKDPNWTDCHTEIETYTPRQKKEKTSTSPSSFFRESAAADDGFCCVGDDAGRLIRLFL